MGILNESHGSESLKIQIWETTCHIYGVIWVIHIERSESLQHCDLGNWGLCVTSITITRFNVICISILADNQDVNTNDEMVIAFVFLCQLFSIWQSAKRYVDKEINEYHRIKYEPVFVLIMFVLFLYVSCLMFCVM